MKKITGYCEIQNKETTIFVDVIGSRALEDGRETYILGRSQCDYASTHFDERCNDCPLRKLING